MSKNLNLTLIALLSLCIIPFAGIVGVRLFSEKKSVTWEALGSPPEKPTHFVAGQVGDYPGGETYNGRETIIYVETESGKIYRCCLAGNTSWLGTKKDDAKDWNWAEKCLGDKEDENRRHFEKETDSYALYWCGEVDFGQAYYALSEDGTVWVWKQYDRFPDNAISNTIVFCKSSGVVAILVLVVGIVFAIRKK